MANDLCCNYRGIEYRVSRDSEGLYETTVRFPGREESAAFSREDIAVANAENLIDDYYCAEREAEEERELQDEYHGQPPHAHQWNEDDYCSICGADGRA